MKRRWGLPAAVAVIAANRTDCCTGQQSSSQTTAAASQETKQESKQESSAAETEKEKGGSSGTLTVAIWDKNQEPGLTKIMADFTKETGIKTQIQVTPWDQYWTMLEAGATGGSLPDVFWMHSNEIDATQNMRCFWT